MSCVSAPNRCSGDFTKPYGTDFAFSFLTLALNIRWRYRVDRCSLLKFCQHADGLFYRRLLVDAMTVIKIDLIDTHSLQTLLTRLSHIVSITPKCWFAIFTYRDAEFGGEKYLLTFTSTLEP